MFESICAHVATGLRVTARALLPLLTVLLLATLASAATICVNAPTGTTGCLINLTQVNVAAAGAAPGDIVKVWPGTYEPFAPASSGVTYIAAIPNQRPIIDASLPITTIGIGQVTNGRGIVIGAGVLGVRIDGFEVINGSPTAAPFVGGGIQITASDVIIARCFVHNNTATQGAGISIAGGAPGGAFARIESCAIQNNGGGIEGGGVFCVDSDSLLIASEIDNNGGPLAGTVGSGGGLFFRRASPTLDNCEIFENEADAFGGGVYFEGSDPTGADIITFTESDVHDNRIAPFGLDGGGVYLVAGAEAGGPPGFAVFAFTVVQDNFAARNGGGIAAGGEVTMSLDYARVLRNTADVSGGGIWAFASPLATVTNSTFDQNRALGSFGPGEGGGIYSNLLLGALSQRLVNVLFVNNFAQDNGGAVASDDSTLSFETCTFNLNSAGVNGGGVYVTSSFAGPVSIDTCILWGDSDLNGGFLKEIFATTSGLVITQFNDWDDGSGLGGAPPCSGPGCINLNPVFTAGPGVLPHQPILTYYLDRNPPAGPASPGIDAGNPALFATLFVPPHITSTTDPAVPIQPDGSAIPADNIDLGFHYSGSPMPPTKSLLTITPVGPIIASLANTITFNLTTVQTPNPTIWVVGGSNTGVSPPTFLPPIVVPLVLDWYSLFLLNGPGTCLFQTPPPTSLCGTVGFVPAGGQVTFRMVLPAGTLTPLIGTTLFHAAVLIDQVPVGGGTVPLARDPSNAVQFQIQ